MKELLSNFQSPEFRSLIYDDIVKMLLKGGASLELAQFLLLVLYSYYKEDYTDESLENLVLRAQEDLLLSDGYRQKRNFQQEVTDTINFRTPGLISIGDIYADLKITEAGDKSACRSAINRLVARGNLEKVDGGRSGTYRLIDNSAEETKFLIEPKGEFKIHLPLELHTMCKIFPHNIIVIAGSKSSGKTSFMLNIALENQNKHKVIYLNSEMGDEEFTERMIKLGCNSPADIKFKCYRKSSNFQDSVNGDKAIHIIDFLEIHDKFYEIGKSIKQIHDKLKDGIAIIGIQKKAGEHLGRGGDFSKEVSRLYLSLDYDETARCTKVRIEEMKSPKHQEGYRNWHRFVKIIDGSRLSPMGNWCI